MYLVTQCSQLYEIKIIIFLILHLRENEIQGDKVTDQGDKDRDKNCSFSLTSLEILISCHKLTGIDQSLANLSVGLE